MKFSMKCTYNQMGGFLEKQNSLEKDGTITLIPKLIGILFIKYIFFNISEVYGQNKTT